MIALEVQGFSHDDANIQRLCGLGGVSRAGYYRHFGPHAPARKDADLRDLVQAPRSPTAITAIGASPRSCGGRA